MLVAFIMGFASGLPLLLTMSVLQAWMKEKGIDLTVIGLTSLLGIPYAVKFLWAPFLDRFTLPFLGRRRGWLLVTQVALVFSISGMGLSDPGDNPLRLVVAALLVTFFSASQDIVVDAYRREDLSDKELAPGSNMYVYGYRLGMLLASGGGLIMADYVSFSMVYLILAACLLPCILTTLLTPEPVTAGSPQTMLDAVVKPLVDYFKRKGALWVLAFIFFYKIGDSIASSITTPFYLDIGFSYTEIGAITKLLGFGAVIAGSFIGGFLMFKLGINRSLWVFGFLQAISTAGFAVLARIGYSIPALSVVISFENLSGGMGTAAFVAFMAHLTNRKFTVTQYALLTSLMAFSSKVASSASGFYAKLMGWENFFIACALIAIPGMLLLLKCAPWNSKEAEKNVVGY